MPILEIGAALALLAGLGGGTIISSRKMENDPDPQPPTPWRPSRQYVEQEAAPAPVIPPQPQSYGAAPREYYSHSPEVRLQKARDGHFYATGQLESLSLRMLVDTGATSCALSDETMRWLDVEHSAPLVVTLGDDTQIVARQFVLPYLTVGAVTVHNVTCNHIPGKMEDILGMSFLEHCDVRIAGNEMIITGLA